MILELITRPFVNGIRTMAPDRDLVARRRLEWWLACYTCTFGLFLVLSPEAFAEPPYRVMRDWAPAPVWGCISSAVGMFHIWALFINGRRYWSAHVRAAATVGNALLFTMALSAILAAVWHGFAPVSATVALYVAPVWASICAFWIAAQDSHDAMFRGDRTHGT